MRWEDEGYARKDEDGNSISFEEYEKEHTTKKRKKFLNLTTGDLQLFGITGVGFFLDSYDLFIINLVTPIWQYEYWGGLAHQVHGGKAPKTHEPPLLGELVNAGSNIGNIIGQLTFGYLGDTFGRKFVYGKELIVCIVGTIMVISLPNSIPTATEKMAWLFCFRVLMGVGIGGDGSIVTLIILACFHKPIGEYGVYSQLDAVWRIQMGLGLVPAFATLYFRLTMPEGKKFKESTELNTPSSSSSSMYKAPRANSGNHTEVLEHAAAIAAGKEKAILPPTDVALETGVVPDTPGASKYATFFIYFKEWRHLKTLLGTTSCWFLLDIAFYGVNLNQSVLLTDIGFSTGSNEYKVLRRNALGNLIIAAAGYVPGYFFTIYFVEKLGRRWIQIQGFLICALMFAILAGDYTNLSTAPKFVMFAIAQAEVFPSRVRGLSHGLSAAVGKMGAILSALLFNYLSGPTVIGLANVLWIFFACNVLGAISTFFLIPETRGVDADVVDYEEWQIANGHLPAKVFKDHTAGKKGVRRLVASLIPRGGG